MGGGKRSVFRERDPESIQHFYEEESDDNRPVSPFRERDKARLQASHALVSSYGGLNSDRSRYVQIASKLHSWYEQLFNSYCV